jgi:hypothetical protein
MTVEEAAGKSLVTVVEGLALATNGTFDRRTDRVAL